jgi:predicted nuclease of predicted toxin-antitoxin system
MADSLIYASAKIANAIVWTQDEDFKGLPGVKYYTKK